MTWTLSLSHRRCSRSSQRGRDLGDAGSTRFRGPNAIYAGDAAVLWATFSCQCGSPQGLRYGAPDLEKTPALQATVHLAGLRCDGLAHSGCQAECNLFWKDEWLKPAANNEESSASTAAARHEPARGCTEAQLLANTHLSSDAEGEEPHYSCQTTEIYEATQPLALWDVR